MSFDRTWRIWFSESASETIVSAAREHHPNEIGGVLLGVSISQRPWVTDAVVVPSKHQTPVYYELPSGARRSAVENAKREDARVGYVGDWHSHPMDIGPSAKDRSTMSALAADASAGCPRPVLVIARRRNGSYTLDLRQQVGRRLRSLRIVAAGALPKGPARRPRRATRDRRSRRER
jgi:proteasome lid subunit RPN8/RPN11